MLTFIVFIHMDDEIASVSSIPDAYARGGAVDRAYEQAKQRHIEGFARYRKLGIRVVNGLEGTPQFIVTGPARAWQKLFRESAAPVFDPRLEITPDDPEWTSEPELGTHRGF